MPAPDTDDVYFVLGTTTIGTNAGRRFQVFEWDELYNSVDLRGANEVMPDAEGRRMFEFVRDIREVTLFARIDGRFDADGARTVGDNRSAASASLRAFEESLDVGIPGQVFEWHDYGLGLAGDAQFLGLRGTRFLSHTLIATSIDLILPPTLEEMV